MYRRLQELGIPSTIVRNSDETLERSERINRILDAYGNGSDVILISNHINAGGAEGAEVVYALRNTPELATLILDNIGDAGQIKRKIYQRRLPENPNKDYYFIIRDTPNLESLLVEYGFIDNANDAQKLKNNLTDYVEGVVKALAEYTNTPYYPPNSETTYYTVKKNDSLYKIAEQFNTTVSEIKRLNNLTTDVLQIGQRLIIPKSQTTSETTYAVKRGDTLYKIAEQFNTTVSELRRLNNLTTDVLQIGQVLIIQPTNSSNNMTYTVKNGDTLYSIATSYGISVEELKRANNLTSNNLYIGQELKIPTTNTNPTEPSNDYQIYTVKKGDSLWSIAREFNIGIPEIIDLNNLETINLKVGDQLKVPKKSSSSNTYIVKNGDTLWSIARENNISVSELKETNNLSNNLLTIGQELIIP